MRRTHARIPTADGVANAYLTLPDDAAPVPAVIVYPDAFGLRPQVERLADRLAGAGYAALVPNVYYRTGPDPVGELPDPIDLAARPDLRSRIRPLMGSLETAGTIRDAGAYLAFLAGSPDVVDDPDSPHLGVASLKAEVYLAHADHDQNMDAGQIARLNAALDDAGVRYRAEVYADAPHGFAVADTTAYRHDAAERHFTELVDLLDRNLSR